MTSSGILENLIAGLIGSFLTFLVTWLIRLWKIKHGAFTGRWSQNIYNPAKPEELTKVRAFLLQEPGGPILRHHPAAPAGTGLLPGFLS